MLLGEAVRDRFDVLAAMRPEMALLREATGQAVTASALVEGLIVGTRGPDLRKSEPSRHPIASERPMEDPMTGLGPEANALLEAARLGDEPTDKDREHVRAAIATRLAAGAAAGLGVATVARAFTAATTRAGLAGAAGAGTLVAFRTSPRSAAPAARIAAPPAPASPEAPARVREGSSVVGSSPAPATLASDEPVTGLHPSERTLTGLRPSARPPPMASVATAPAGSTRAASSPGDVAAEVRLLGDAQSEMRAGEPERALLLFDEHARRYPKGALGEERDAARIGALCALGRISEAREATDRFLRAAPLSPHAGPLRASCGGSPAAPASNF